MNVPSENTPVAAAEELRRAVRPGDLDPDTLKPTSAAFKSTDLSVDVGSLATLDESRVRWPTRYWAITICQWFIDIGHQPTHKPLPENIAHAEVPGKLNKRAKEIANRVQIVHPPLVAGP